MEDTPATETTEPVITTSAEKLETKNEKSEFDRTFLRTRGLMKAVFSHDPRRSLSLLTEKKRELEIYTHRLVKRALPPLAPRKSCSPKIRKIQCGDFLSSPTSGK